VGGLKRRIGALEERASDKLRDAQEEERLRLQRAITRMILDEFARLKASGGQGDLIERSVRNVVEDQYADLSPENRQYIAEGWTETIHSWTRLDWMISAGREGPPRA
jgi:hypothetical protein